MRILPQHHTPPPNSTLCGAKLPLLFTILSSLFSGNDNLPSKIVASMANHSNFDTNPPFPFVKGDSHSSFNTS